MNPVLAEFLARQVDLIEAGDAAGLAERYADDAELARFDRVARGRAEIREMLADYMRRAPTILERQAAVTTDDVIFYRARMRLDGRDVTTVGTIVFREGLVWRQTAAFLDDDAGPAAQGR